MLHRKTLLTISSVNKQYRWLTGAICQKQTLIQIYKCKCGVSWHLMSDHTPGKTKKKLVWKGKLFLSTDITKFFSLLDFAPHFYTANLKKNNKKTEVCFHYRVQVSRKLQNPPLRSILDQTHFPLRNPQKASQPSRFLSCHGCDWQQNDVNKGVYLWRCSQRPVGVAPLRPTELVNQSRLISQKKNWRARPVTQPLWHHRTLQCGFTSVKLTCVA